MSYRSLRNVDLEKGHLRYGTSSNASEEAQDFLQKNIKKHRDEGMDEDQAVAAAYDEARREGYSVPKK